MKKIKPRVRNLLLIISLLLFPVTLYYFSPALIVNGAFNHIMNGSFIVFLAMLILSIPFGRIFCGWLCPSGGLQECLMQVNDRIPRRGWRLFIKYAIWAVWIALVVFLYIQNGGIQKVDFFFETDNGISVHDFQSYVIYYGILLLILIPALIGGRRTFCQYFCWMAPFMAIGMRIRQALHLPGLHITVKSSNLCKHCNRCSKSCPMGIDVASFISKGQIRTTECIQCGSCVDNCPVNILQYSMKYQRGQKNGE